MLDFTYRQFLAVAMTFAIAVPALAQAPRSPTPQPVEAPIRATTVAEGLEHPWGLAFLPDGRMLVTERPGRLRIVERDGRISEPLGGVPEVFARGQGGLLDVALSPNFAQDRLVYLSYAEPGEGGAGTAVARGQLTDNALQNVEVIWRQVPKVSGPNHWGSRLVFARDGTLFITTGDRFEYRELAQDLSTTIGKVVRINADGSIPQDNPFVGREGVRPEIWSYGHRNVQAAALHPETGELWTVMHGARGGDELNQPQAGKNYGWPVITYGVDYSGAKIGEGTAKEGMEQPVYYWDPVIAP
jgi:glucose/arabinose dehydrogenase